MFVLYLALLGWLLFSTGAFISGIWLRKNSSKEQAEKSSRIMHFLFFVGLGFPVSISFFYPGLRGLDPLLGWPPLPMKPLFIVTGMVLAFPGLYLLGLSNKKLRALGEGANAFRLTKQVVNADLYKYLRNPMSLGYYLSCLSIAFLAGSTLLTLYVVLGIIPAHVFFLKFFEEYELEYRFGESYREYKQQVPFLIPKIPQA